MIIYKITNTINGKVYIGKTEGTLQNRWQAHKDARRYSLCALHNALRKYGIGSFTIKKIFTAESSELLNRAECNFIRKYQSNNPKFGYNMTPGGDGRPKGKPQSVESRRKNSIALRGRVKSKEHLENISLALQGRVGGMQGRKHSEETKLRMSEKAKARRHTEETKKKLSAFI